MPATKAKSRVNLRILHSIEKLGLVHAVRGDIRVEKLEARLIPKVAFPHKHDFFQIIFMTSGAGWHEVDFVRHAVTKNQIFILKPGQVHEWRLGKGSKGFVIEFTTESLPDSSLSYEVETLPDCILLNTRNSKLATDLPLLLKMMNKEFLLQPADFKRCLQAYLTVFLLQLFRAAKNLKKRVNLKDDFNRQFSRLVEEHYRAQHGLVFYANQMKTSPKSLSAKIQRAFGKPAKDIIQERCLLEAKRFLSFTDWAVADIGYELGFEDPNYFSRFLKQKMKVSAHQFREDFKKTHLDI